MHSHTITHIIKNKNKSEGGEGWTISTSIAMSTSLRTWPPWYRKPHPNIEPVHSSWEPSAIAVHSGHAYDSSPNSPGECSPSQHHKEWKSHRAELQSTEARDWNQMTTGIWRGYSVIAKMDGTGGLTVKLWLITSVSVFSSYSRDSSCVHTSQGNWES